MSKSVKFVKIVSPIALAIALAACGGGGSGANFGSNTGGTTGGGTGGSTTETLTRSIELSVSSRQLPSDGSAPITITAIAKDDNNNAIDGADIIFSVDKDATIIKDATITTVVDPDNPTGTPVTTVVTAGSIQTATLTPGSSTNQTLTVTVISGSSSESISVDVVGTNVNIEGPAGITLGQDSPYVLKLKDSSNNPIAFQQVVLSSANGNQISTESNFETDAEGEIAFNLTGSTSGIDVISASVLGASFDKAVEVSGDEFRLSSSGDNEEIDINTTSEISFRWTRDGVPQVGKTIVLSATRGDINNQSTVTNSAGDATFTISSQTAGQTVITATSTEGLSTSLNREFVATTPRFLNSQATPALIAPNTSSTIVARVRDEDDNPVKNKVIDFRLRDTVDGVLSASTATTDSLGRASVSYTAGNSSSNTDGVVITTFVQGFPTVASDEVRLTVGGSAIRLTLGDDQLLESQEIFYIKQFGVIVTDSAGNPIANQDVSFKITPTEYYKGFMSSSNGDSWVRFNTLSNRLGDSTTSCISEDFDNDGNLDTDKGEDINNNGTLEPTRDATVTGSGQTDDSGRIVVEVIYPKNTALWSKQVITATTQVVGTEFVETTEFILPVAADDVDDISISPPNTLSPYGLGNRCDDPSDNFSLPINPTVVEGLTGLPVTTIQNDTIYTVRFSDALGNNVDGQNFTITSSVANINSGLPNNSFSVSDNDPAVDGSGFHIELVSNGMTSALFYEDDEAVLPPEPEVDTNGPILTLNGSSIITLNLGDVYVEAGANAVDLKDGPLQVTQVGAVPVDGANVTTTSGNYTVIYTVTDSDGNETNLTRTVIINP